MRQSLLLTAIATHTIMASATLTSRTTDQLLQAPPIAAPSAGACQSTGDCPSGDVLYKPLIDDCGQDVMKLPQDYCARILSGDRVCWGPCDEVK